MKVQFKKISSLLVLVVFIVSIQACATSHKASRGRLSDAMDKASDKNKGSRRVEVQERYHRPSPPPRYEEDTGVSDNRPYAIKGDPVPDNVLDTTSEQEDDQKGTRPFGLSGGIGLLKSDDFSEMINLELSIGFAESKYSRYEIYVGAAWAGTDHASELDRSINNGVLLLSLGMNYKRKIFNNTEWNAPYILFGAAYDKMFWSYENPITTTDGETIRRDGLEGIELKAGLGQQLLRANGKNMGIEVYPSVIFWLSPTDQGFVNDVFDPFVMLNVRAVFFSW